MARITELAVVTSYPSTIDSTASMIYNIIHSKELKDEGATISPILIGLLVLSMIITIITCGVNVWQRVLLRKRNVTLLRKRNVYNGSDFNDFTSDSVITTSSRDSFRSGLVGSFGYLNPLQRQMQRPLDSRELVIMEMVRNQDEDTIYSSIPELNMADDYNTKV